MEIANENDYYICVNSAHKEVGKILLKNLSVMNQQSGIHLFVITRFHQSYGTWCEDDFIVIRAIHGGNPVKKECKQLVFLVGWCKKPAQFLAACFYLWPFPYDQFLSFLLLILWCCWGYMCPILYHPFWKFRAVSIYMEWIHYWHTHQMS